MFGDTKMIKEEKDFRRRAMLEEIDADKEYEVEVHCVVHLRSIDVEKTVKVRARTQDDAEEKAIDLVCDSVDVPGGSEIEEVDVDYVTSEILGLENEIKDGTTLELFRNDTHTEIRENK